MCLKKNKKILPIKSHAIHFLVMRIFFSFFFLVPILSINAQNVTILPIKTESASSLFNYNKDDNNIEFFASGSWESKLLGSSMFTYEKNKPLQFKFNPIVFMQKADLSLWFLLNKKWYFEANFIDGYNKNSVAAGYYGDGILKQARIGNSGIQFPQKYDALIGEGSIISPGFMADFGGKNWELNAAVRYDNAVYGEKTFSGKNELYKQTAALNNWQRGQRFTLPTTAYAADIKDLYVEDSDSAFADFTDSNGRKYRKLQTSEYFIIASEPLIILNKPVKSRLLVTFLSLSTYAALQNNADETGLSGGFGTAQSPTANFLGQIQSLFASAETQKPNLYEFSYANSQTSANGFFVNLLNGAGQALILFDLPLFSPFEIANRYNMGNSSGTLSVTYIPSGVEVPFLQAVFISESTIEQTQNFAQMYRTDETFPLTKAQARYPAAHINPYGYLLPSSQTPQPVDIGIHAQNYLPVAAYIISTQAIPGTIRVFKNGLIDTAYTYKPLTGEIIFTTQPAMFDTIRITWLENGVNAPNASLAGAIGFTYNMLPELTFLTQMSVRWSFSDRKFSDSSYSLPGSAELAAEIKWKKENLLLKNTVKGAVTVADVTGTYLILDLNNAKERILYLPDNCAVPLPNGIVPYLNTFPIPQNQLLYANKKNMYTQTVSGSKYNFLGYAAELEFAFDFANQWAAQTINLGTNAAELQSAQEFSVLIKAQIPNPTDYSVFLQLGVSATENFSYENTASIRTWEITDKIALTNWNTIKIQLSDADRAALTQNSNARIVVVAKNASTGNLTVGPASFSGMSFIQTKGNPVTIENITVSRSSRFSPAILNSVLQLTWDWKTQNAQAEVIRAVSEIPLSSYKTLKFYVQVKDLNNAKITVYFKRRTQNGNESVLEYQLSPQDLIMNQWNLVSIPIQNAINSPTQIAIQIDSTNIDPLNPDSNGKIQFADFFLEGNEPTYSAQNTAEFNWQSDSVLLSSGNLHILSRPKAAVKTTAALNKQNEHLNADFDLHAETGITLLELDISGFIYKEQKKLLISSAGHSLKSNWKIFNISENYLFNAAFFGTQKKDSAEITATVFTQPLIFSFFTEGGFLNNFAKQTAQIHFESSFPISSAIYTLRTQFQAEQLQPLTPQKNEDYATNYAKISTVQFSTGYANAQQRVGNAQIYQQIELPFAHFIPSIQINSVSRYTHTNTTTHTDYTTSLLDFPFIVKQNQLRFFWQKSSGAEKNTLIGGNYFSDANLYADSISKQTWFFVPLPIVDLFLPTIEQQMKHATQNQSVFNKGALIYNSVYGFVFQKPSFFNLLDLCIPSKIRAQFSKEIRSSSTALSENYKAETILTLNAYNLFGKLSAHPLFNWYEQDELMQSYTITAQFGKNARETVVISVNAYLSLMLYFTAKNFLKTENSFQMQTNGNWKLLNALQITYFGNESFIKSLALFFKADLAQNPPMKIERKETFSYNASKTNIMYHEITASHKMTTFVTQIISFSTEINAAIIIEKDKTTVQNSLTLSGKLTF